MVFTFALLYSNQTLKDRHTQNLLCHVKKTIKSDHILSQSLHLICIDNDYVREIMKTNSIYTWPIFIIKRPSKAPEFYSLSEADNIFDEVYKVHNYFLRLNTSL
jgi:hypothetical protein